MNSPLTRLVQDNCYNLTDAGAELAALLDLNTLNLTIGYQEIMFPVSVFVQWVIFSYLRQENKKFVKIDVVMYRNRSEIMILLQANIPKMAD